MYKLREVEKEDIKEINSWRKNEDIIKFLGTPYRFINIEVDEEWYENYMKNRNNTIRCAITEENDKIIGLVTLSDVNYINRSCVLHIMIGENSQNKGAGTYAISRILKHAFMDLNMNRVELLVLADNERAIKVYEKSGFKVEGMKKEACFKNGQYLDQLEMAILKNEYLEKKEGRVNE